MGAPILRLGKLSRASRHTACKSRGGTQRPSWDGRTFGEVLIMARIVADDLAVCTDCALVIANGEIGDGTARGDEIAGDRFAAAVIR